MTEEELLKGLEGLAPPEERPEPEIEAGRRRPVGLPNSLNFDGPA